MTTSRSVRPRSFFGASALLGAIAILAGCAGNQSPMSPTAPQSAQSMQSSTMGFDACRQQGGVRVTPCKVVFTASNPGPDTVTLRTPHGAKGSVVEHDNCGGVSGVATVTQGTGDTWTVTAGSTAGTCHARFNYFNNGQKVGFAVLTIVNQI